MKNQVKQASKTATEILEALKAAAAWMDEQMDEVERQEHMLDGHDADQCVLCQVCEAIAKAEAPAAAGDVMNVTIEYADGSSATYDLDADGSTVYAEAIGPDGRTAADGSVTIEQAQAVLAGIRFGTAGQEQEDDDKCLDCEHDADQCAGCVGHSKFLAVAP